MEYLPFFKKFQVFSSFSGKFGQKFRDLLKYAFAWYSCGEALEVREFIKNQVEKLNGYQQFLDKFHKL